MNTVTLPFEEFVEENVKEKVVKMKWMENRKFSLAKDLEEVREFVDGAIDAGKCVVDLETTGLNTRMVLRENGERTPGEKIVGFGLCFDSSFGLYIAINHDTGSEHNLPEKEVLEEMERLCKFCITIYHNAKFDLAMMRNYGIIVSDAKMFEDTLILARLFDAGRKEIKLKKLSDIILDQKMLEFKDVTSDVKRFDLVNPTTGYVYGVCDAVCTFDLYNFFMAQEIVQNQKLVYNLEKRTVFVVMEMEHNLIKVNKEYLKSLLDKARERVAIRKKEILALAERDFNIGSPLQLGAVLFDELNFTYPTKIKTASGQYKTDDKTLKKIEDDYPVVAKILEYRKLEKLAGTYLKKLYLNTDPEGFIKLGFNQSGTDTGRFSSPGGFGLEVDGYSGVNIQSMPKKASKANPDLDLREAFVARDGFTLVAIDYENEEMRVATNLSHEKVWADAVRNGVDFHTTTAALISGKDVKDVTPDERKVGKTTNFLSLYLGGAYTLADQAKISVAEAKRVLAAYFAGLPSLKKWIDKEIAKARKVKVVKTIFGRTRPLKSSYDSGDKGQSAHGDRCAINTQIQGASADIMKAVMVKIHSWLHRNNFQDDVKILITMHDELVFEVRTDRLEFFTIELCKMMMLKEVINDQLKWEIPLTVDVQYGPTWRVAGNYFKEFPELKKKLDEPIFECDPVKADDDKIVKGNSRYDIAKKDIDIPKEKEVDKKEKASEPVTEESEQKKGEAVVAETEVEGEQVEEQVADQVDEVKNEEVSKDKKYYIYTVRDTGEATKRNLNFILDFLVHESPEKKDSYEGPRRVLKIKDVENNDLMVSEFDIPVDAFRGLARIFRV